MFPALKVMLAHILEHNRIAATPGISGRPGTPLTIGQPDISQLVHLSPISRSSDSYLYWGYDDAGVAGLVRLTPR